MKTDINKSYNFPENSVLIVIVTNIDDDDFSILFDNLRYKEKVLVICDKKSAEGYKGKVKFLTDEFTDYKSLVKKIKVWEKENEKNITGIIGLDEEYHYRLSYNLSKELSLDFYDKDVLDMCSNKYLQRMVLKKAGVNVPNFELVSLENTISKISYPKVVKIVTGYASTHVYLSKNNEEFADALKNIKNDSYENEVIFSEHSFYNDKHFEILDPKKQIIIEEFIEGTEYSCDYIVENGLIFILRVTKKITKKEHFSFFHGYYLFNPRNNLVNDCLELSDLIKVCKTSADALKINKGVCMMDFIISKGKIFVIETTTRPGISTFTDLIAKIYPFTSMDLLIRQKLGLKTEYIIPDITGLVAYITAEKEGTIKKYNTDNLKKIKGFLKVCKYYEEGEKIFKDEKIPKLAGYVLVSNVKSDEIENIMSEIKKNTLLEIF
jgi:hypothetical protein